MFKCLKNSKKERLFNGFIIHEEPKLKVFLFLILRTMEQRDCDLSEVERSLVCVENDADILGSGQIDVVGQFETVSTSAVAATVSQPTPEFKVPIGRPKRVQRYVKTSRSDKILNCEKSKKTLCTKLRRWYHCHGEIMHDFYNLHEMIQPNQDCILSGDVMISFVPPLIVDNDCMLDLFLNGVYNQSGAYANDKYMVHLMAKLDEHMNDYEDLRVQFIDLVETEVNTDKFSSMARTLLSKIMSIWEVLENYIHTALVLLAAWDDNDNTTRNSHRCDDKKLPGISRIDIVIDNWKKELMENKTVKIETKDDLLCFEMIPIPKETGNVFYIYCIISSSC